MAFLYDAADRSYQLFELCGCTKDVAHFAVEVGSVNAEVSLELSGGIVLHAVITKASVQGMGLKAGDTATALFKASTVILAVPA